MMITEEEKAEYEEYRNNRELFPLSEFSRLCAEPDVRLPASGNYWIVANNEAEIRAFFMKLEIISPFQRVGYLDEYWYDDDDEDYEHLPSEIVRTMEVNQFFKLDEQLQLHKTDYDSPIQEKEIVFAEGQLELITFPCIVLYGASSDCDQRGNFSVNYCQINNLGNIPLRNGPVEYHLNWI